MAESDEEKLVSDGESPPAVEPIKLMSSAQRLEEQRTHRRNEVASTGELVTEIIGRITERLEQNPPQPLPATDEKAAHHERRMRIMLTRQIPVDAALCILGGSDGGGGGNGLLETNALRHVREFMNAAPGTFVISGGVGCGKTVAASWAISEKCPDRYIGTHPDGHDGTWPADYHPRFIDVTELDLMPRWGTEAQQALAPLKRCSMLAIDDIGNEADEKAVVKMLDAIIVARHGNRLRTILTTNINAEIFTKRYGQRIVDRIRGTGGFWELGDSPSMR